MTVTKLVADNHRRFFDVKDEELISELFDKEAVSKQISSNEIIAAFRIGVNNKHVELINRLLLNNKVIELPTAFVMHVNDNVIMQTQISTVSTVGVGINPLPHTTLVGLGMSDGSSIDTQLIRKVSDAIQNPFIIMVLDGDFYKYDVASDTYDLLEIVDIGDYETDTVDINSFLTDIIDTDRMVVESLPDSDLKKTLLEDINAGILYRELYGKHKDSFLHYTPFSEIVKLYITDSK